MNTKPVHITTRQVADRFGVNIATVRRWVNAGIVTPEVTTPGGHHRFSQANVEALAAAHSSAKVDQQARSA